MNNNHQVPSDFVAIFRELVVACQPRGLTRDTPAVYWAALGQSFSLDVLRESAQQLVRRLKFFPTTAEWTQAATAVVHARILEGRLAESVCEWCHDRGLMCVQYRSGEPFDVAVCSCRASHFFRKAGLEFVRGHLQLAPDHRIAYIEDFEDEETHP
jgi:hypothetical protein